MSPRWLIAFDDRAAAPQYLVGERWTLLIVRELLTGPKRYTDLREGPPGIASNLLADRPGQLEEGGSSDASASRCRCRRPSTT